METFIEICFDVLSHLPIALIGALAEFSDEIAFKRRVILTQSDSVQTNFF